MSTVIDDLASIPVFAGDDDAINFDTYQDALPPTPPKEGIYVLQIKKFALDKDKDGNLKLTNNAQGQPQYPVVNLERVEIREPLPLEGKVAFTFMRIFTSPYTRNGIPASTLADLTRAHDVERTWRVVPEGLEALSQLVDEQRTFRARLTWEAFDTEHYKQLVIDNGGEQAVKTNKDLRKELNKKCTFIGMKKFDKAPDGSYLPVLTNPVSGNQLTARVRVAEWIPSTKQNVKLIEA